MALIRGRALIRDNTVLIFLLKKDESLGSLGSYLIVVSFANAGGIRD